MIQKTILLDEETTELAKDKGNLSEYIRSLIRSDTTILSGKEELEKQYKREQIKLDNIVQKIQIIEIRLRNIYEQELNRLQKTVIDNQNTFKIAKNLYENQFKLIKKSRFLIDLIKIKPKNYLDKELFQVVIKMRDAEKLDVYAYQLYWFLCVHGYIQATTDMTKWLVDSYNKSKKSS